MYCRGFSSAEPFIGRELSTTAVDAHYPRLPDMPLLLDVDLEPYDILSALMHRGGISLK